MAANPVIGAIFRRDLRSWFTNPTGYVFITLFVLLCAFALFIPPKFFLENTASLGPLQDWFRVLLLFFIPAITMMVWAGERGQGTDEILLTLPASDSKIVLGKFLAACGVYTVSLAFTFLLPVWLQLLGKPDWGLIVTSYFAFWSLGVFLISVGMVGSILTDNLTVAFILGAVFCAIAVFLEDLLGFLAPRTGLGDGPVALFEQMSRGLVTLPALVFFGGSTAVFLYMNRVLLSRRRWTKPPRARPSSATTAPTISSLIRTPRSHWMPPSACAVIRPPRRSPWPPPTRPSSPTPWKPPPACAPSCLTVWPTSSIGPSASTPCRSTRPPSATT